jgi:hypothetical protein
MTVSRVLAATALIASVGLAGCQSTAKALGMNKVTPDEFRVVTKAPLVVPPDYSLRPPAPGEPRPQELQPESAARVALLGAREAEARSDGEKLLVAKAGAALDRGAYRSVGLSGGVANNRTLRQRLANAAAQRGLPMFLAEPRHCGDNAAMIAFAAWSEPDRPADVAPAPALTVDQA